MRINARDFSKLFFYLLCIPVVIFSCFIQIVNFILSLINKHYYKIDLEIARIDEMDGREFEIFTSELLQKLNFKSVMKTKASGDFGVDVIAYRDNCKYAVQCKRYNAPVGVRAIQETIGGQKFYKANKSIVVTNSTFTKNAILMAAECDVELWDRTKLLRLVKQIDSPSYNIKQSTCKNNNKKFSQLNQDVYNFHTNISESNKKTNIDKVVESQRKRILLILLNQIKVVKLRISLNQVPSNKIRTIYTQQKELTPNNKKTPFIFLYYLKMVNLILFNTLGFFLIILGFFTLFVYSATGLFIIISGLVSLPVLITKITFIRNLSYGKLVAGKVFLIVFFFFIAILFVPIN